MQAAQSDPLAVHYLTWVNEQMRNEAERQEADEQERWSIDRLKGYLFASVSVVALAVIKILEL